MHVKEIACVADAIGVKDRAGKEVSALVMQQWECEGQDRERGFSLSQ